MLTECRESNGSAVKAKGTAKLADAKGPNSKLKVTFFWPFYGDYWVMDLDPEYKWAVVGDPDRKYLWILSRTPQLTDEIYRGILDRARGQSYQLDALAKTRQSN